MFPGLKWAFLIAMSVKRHDEKTGLLAAGVVGFEAGRVLRMFPLGVLRVHAPDMQVETVTLTLLHSEPCQCFVSALFRNFLAQWYSIAVEVQGQLELLREKDVLNMCALLLFPLLGSTRWPSVCGFGF